MIRINPELLRECCVALAEKENNGGVWRAGYPKCIGTAAARYFPYLEFCPQTVKLVESLVKDCAVMDYAEMFGNRTSAETASLLRESIDFVNKFASLRAELESYDFKVLQEFSDASDFNGAAEACAALYSILEKHGVKPKE